MSKFEVGDLIKLTGDGWIRFDSGAEYERIVLVLSLDQDGDPCYRSTRGKLDVAGYNDGLKHDYAAILISKGYK